MKLKFFSILNILVGLTLLCGCGKFGPPLPPEAMSPIWVDKLKVTPDPTKVTFNWHSPWIDRRGKSLKSIDGYHIYRKTIIQRADIVDNSVPYQMISTVEDSHLKELETRREVKRDKDEPWRNLKADPNLTVFTYTDTGVQDGSTYVYKIVPFNQGDVEGRADKLVKIAFRGTSGSDVSFIENPIKEDEKFKTQQTIYGKKL